MNKPLYTVAVTGLNAIDSPGPGLAVIRGLKAANYFDVRIVGLSYENLEPGIYLHEWVDKTYQIPYPSAGQDALLERLSYIIEQEKIDFIIPNFDAELNNFIKLQSRLENLWQVKMFLPTMEQFEARHKTNLSQFGEQYGIKVPFAQPIFHSQEITLLNEQLTYPFFVKGKFYDAKLVYNQEQATQIFHKISAEWGLPVLLQKMIKGLEVNVCGLGDGLGNLIGAVPMRKLYITDKGKAWAGITLADEELINLSKQIVEKTKWKGPFELEFIKTDNKDYYLLEINPRFPAWCFLTVGAGQNQMEALVNLGLGQIVKPFQNYQVGKMFIRYAQDMIVDIKEFEQISTTGEL